MLSKMYFEGTVKITRFELRVKRARSCGEIIESKRTFRGVVLKIVLWYFCWFDEDWGKILFFSYPIRSKCHFFLIYSLFLSVEMGKIWLFIFIFVWWTRVRVLIILTLFRSLSTSKEIFRCGLWWCFGWCDCGDESALNFQLTFSEFGLLRCDFYVLSSLTGCRSIT